MHVCCAQQLQCLHGVHATICAYGLDAIAMSKPKAANLWPKSLSLPPQTRYVAAATLTHTHLLQGLAGPDAAPQAAFGAMAAVTA
jgi:hypothetical protein